ncbi:MAG: hypothetical protein LJE69_00920 [Thiohalocapsa sp.]|jgi:hypothetical protein|nr:hypothetical protein [Thiohalocapsa sp.]MCG6939800.1 hypothetical protein [Thiohalocapsa sp.]
MLQIVFWVLVGILIGWNLPEPAWARQMQDGVVNFVKELLGKSKSQ